MPTKHYIATCNYISHLLRDTYREDQKETVANYATYVLRNVKNFIDNFKGKEKDLEEILIYYQMAFSDFVEFQQERMERV